MQQYETKYKIFFIKMTRAAQKNILQSIIIFILIESFRFTS